MKRYGLILMALLTLCACKKDSAGDSSFELETPESTLLFTAGQTVSLSYKARDLEVLTAKAPKGWKASAGKGSLSITAPEIGTDYLTNGQVGVYARGKDKEEYAVNIPVKVASLIGKTGFSIVYCSSQDAANPAKNLLDGEQNTVWSSSGSDKAPFYTVIDLGRQYSITNLDIWAQTGSDGKPYRQCAEAVVDFATEIRGNGMADLGGTGSGNWADRHSFYSDRLLNREHNSVALKSAVNARYLRIHYLKAYLDDSTVSPSGVSGAALAEIDIYGF
ncbi:MAG: discoidin domain-containing protein [Bacteroidales bacterium]|nr:discoidin domain-containing protein [Bacteroidales bacterium]